MSFVSSLTWELLPNCNAACSTFTKSFFFLTSSLWTLPKFLWLHWVNSVPHLAIFFITWTLGSQWNGALQTTSTVRPHPLSESHISSNRNGFKIGGGSRPFGTIQIGTWSKMVLWRWKTHVPTNRWSQSLVQKTLSRLSHMDWPLAKCLLQVNLELEYPRSKKLHASIASQKSCIWLWFLLLPPNFSLLPSNSLKSPAHNHGIWNFWFSLQSKIHDSDLLYVSGSP